MQKENHPVKEIYTRRENYPIDKKAHIFGYENLLKNFRNYKKKIIAITSLKENQKELVVFTDEGYQLLVGYLIIDLKKLQEMKSNGNIND